MVTGRRLFVICAIAACAAAVALGRFYFLLSVPLVISEPVEITIRRGESPRSVAERAADANVVRSANALLFLIRTSGRDREIRYGVHSFFGPMTPDQVLTELTTSPTPVTRVTITEGMTTKQIATMLEREEIVDAEAYLAAVCDDSLLERIGAKPSANCAEGYLFPDTYDLAPEMTAEEVVDLQIRHFDNVMDELLTTVAPSDTNALTRDLDAATWRSKPEVRHAFVADVVTLASIIEKEAQAADERGLVSSVFHNRLLRGIRLQADPTVVYGIELAGMKLVPGTLHHHLREPSPYNTYTEVGLPPGPICNPGRESLTAALDPAKSKFLYFVARGDGTHEFTATLAAHNRAVARLRKR